MSMMPVLHSLLALVFVLGLIVILSFILKKYGGEKIFSRVKDKGGRLSVSDMLVIDGRRKLILVKRDDTEHLLLIGPEKEVIIESGIKQEQDKKRK